jgi:hypothetical protein
VCKPTSFELVDRDSCLDAPGVVPDAEPHVRIFVDVARDTQCLPRVARMRREELDELAA